MQKKLIKEYQKDDGVSRYTLQYSAGSAEICRELGTVGIIKARTNKISKQIK